MLRNLATSEQRRLLDCYNNIWWSGQVPEAWRTAIVAPILKSNKPANELSSYRPVSLTSAACKVMEAIALARLEWVARACGFLADQQTGFRRRRCTADSIADVVSTLEDARASGDLAMLLLIDVKGAFDGLPHAVVQQALDLLGIGGNLRRFLSSFLNDRTLRVRVGHARSTPRPVAAGVPQGSVVSPFLFNLALARLPAALPTDPRYKVECSIYADDIALWVRGPPQSSRHVCLALQRALDTTAAYLGSIGLSNRRRLILAQYRRSGRAAHHKARLRKIQRSIEEYTTMLPSDHWMGICESINGQTHACKGWAILRSLLGQRKTNNGAARVGLREGISTQELAEQAAQVHRRLEAPKSCSKLNNLSELVEIHIYTQETSLRATNAGQRTLMLLGYQVHTLPILPNKTPPWDITALTDGKPHPLNMDPNQRIRRLAYTKRQAKDTSTLPLTERIIPYCGRSVTSHTCSTNAITMLPSTGSTRTAVSPEATPELADPMEDKHATKQRRAAYLTAVGKPLSIPSLPSKCPLYIPPRLRALATIKRGSWPSSLRTWACPDPTPPDHAIELWRALLLFLQDPAAPPVGDRLRDSHQSHVVPP
ncbi:hypothetical protein HPB49_007794 [Dermacentor silvarum]|uniref:Uncharacterized protein n=1 Tax=Dermacentor silvarum TaxID=543639 RepID=A0ACB8DC25_DERSI|nr:hypothetical protein HPB49_007794 [Dermacentor silvarum]